MFIETGATSNPATLKFLPGRDVLGSRGTADFAAPADAAGRSPLAERVFLVGDVARVFLGADYGFDATRPGICLYGGGPEGRPDARIRPVATLAAEVL